MRQRWIAESAKDEEAVLKEAAKRNPEIAKVLHAAEEYGDGVDGLIDLALAVVDNDHLLPANVSITDDHVQALDGSKARIDFEGMYIWFETTI